jgi:peroxiredoxin/uncharacterized membrane protein YphA (DoxX/SURF4 family)
MLPFLLRVTLAAVFGLAGFAKLADRLTAARSLVDFGVPASVANPAAVLLAAVELTCAIALLPATSAWFGAVGVMAMLVLFITVIAASLARGRRPACHCFGQLHSKPIGAHTLVRDFVLLLAAGNIVALGRGQSGSSLADVARSAALASPTSWLVALSLASTTGLILIAFHLLKQNGRLLLRLEAIEAKLGIDSAAALAPGLPAGAAAPSFMLPSLDDGRVSLATLRHRGLPVLLVFAEPGCGACEALLSDVGVWQRRHADRLTVAVVSRGDAETNRTKAARHEVRRVLLQQDREVSEAYKVAGIPSAVLITEGAVSSPLAVGADAIRTLVVKTTLPQLRRGDPVPSLELPDLDGRRVDLSTLRERTLLLFWNPACGFCQRMLDEVKAWERAGDRDAPALVVLSRGTAEANRSQGFRSRVLLDEHFHAGEAFGATGTPSAVLIDQDGRVVSDVAVGAQAVFELAGSAPAMAST